MPGPPSASSSKPTRPAGANTQHSKPTSGVKRPRTQSVSEDDRPAQVARTQGAPTGKGKAKEDLETLDEEGDGGEVEVDGEVPLGMSSETDQKEKEYGGVSANGRGGESIVSLQRRIRELRSKLADTESSREKYRTQLQKLHQLRHTDPEKNVQDMEKLWEERNKVQEERIAELRRYAGLLSKDDDTPQKRIVDLEGENARLKAELGRARQQLSDAERTKEHEKELEAEIRRLNETLQQEINYSKRIHASNKVVTNTKPDPTSAKITKLYEDMTNITISDCRTEKAENGLNDNDVYNCVVTVDGRSVGFKLGIHVKSSSQPTTPGKSTSLETLVSYTPTSLSQETNQDLLDSLDFLCEPFDFSPEQFDTFLRTLVDRVRGT